MVNKHNREVLEALDSSRKSSKLVAVQVAVGGRHKEMSGAAVGKKPENGNNTNRDSRAVRSAIVSGRVAIEAPVHWLFRPSKRCE